MSRPTSKNQVPQTQWSLIGRTAASDATVRRTAIAELVIAYEPALRGFLVGKLKVRQDAAAEIIQAFVTERIVEKGILAKADRARGQFRSFLIKAGEISKSCG